MSSSSSTGHSEADLNLFSFDEDKQNAHRRAHPWTNDPRYFKGCHISALATMKMIKHGLAGVKKGRETLGNYIQRLIL